MIFTEWWRGCHGFVKFVIPFFVVISSGLAATTAWMTMGWWTPASQDWVRSENAKSESRLRDVAAVVIGLAREQRERLRRVRDGHVARLALAKDQQIREDIQALIIQDDQDIADVEARIVALENLRK